jgi:hypothetical protein
MISEAIRTRYLRDPLPVRLGGLAADLARIASFAEHAGNQRAVESLFEEAKHFAEWAAPEAPLDIQAALAQVQVQLALWQRRWLAGRPESLMREEAQRWSDQLLALSGLV